MNTMLVAHQTLSELAVAVPSATRVFQRHRLDFCCHGDRPLADACDDAGVDADQVLDEITREHQRATEPLVRWDERPLPALIAHILERYHAPLYPELDLLNALANKLLEVHGDAEGPRLAQLVCLVSELSNELRQHMRKEETVLFPWIESGQGRTAAAPVRVMHLEHEAAGEQLARLRDLTGDFTPPANACVTWVALYVRLEDLDRELREHIHLENNVLFPRALTE